MNTHGKLFRLTTFGESHGPYIGGVIDDCPAGLRVDTEEVPAGVAESPRDRPHGERVTGSTLSPVSWTASLPARHSPS